MNATWARMIDEHLTFYIGFRAFSKALIKLCLLQSFRPSSLFRFSTVVLAFFYYFGLRFHLRWWKKSKKYCCSIVGVGWCTFGQHWYFRLHLWTKIMNSAAVLAIINFHYNFQLHLLGQNRNRAAALAAFPTTHTIKVRSTYRSVGHTLNHHICLHLHSYIKEQKLHSSSTS